MIGHFAKSILGTHPAAVEDVESHILSQLMSINDRSLC